jgi:hypothetical protein
MRVSLDSVKDLVVELEDTAQLYQKIARTFLSTTSWYSNLSEESQERLTYLGLHLLNLTTEYITNPSKREDTIELARDVGNGFGETLASLGLPLTESLETFILHRNPIMNATTRLIKKKEAFIERGVEATPLVAQVMDVALVALVAAHQQYPGLYQNES